MPSSFTNFDRPEIYRSLRFYVFPFILGMGQINHGMTVFTLAGSVYLLLQSAGRVTTDRKFTSKNGILPVIGLLLFTFVIFPKILMPFKEVSAAALIAVTGVLFYGELRNRIMQITVWEICGSVLLVLFLILYYAQHKSPVMPKHINASLDLWGYFLNAFPVALIFFTVLSIDVNWLRKHLLFSLTAGMFIFAALNTIFTLALLVPPYYGKAYHFAGGAILNSPGTTILASMLPLVLISFWPLNTVKSEPYAILALLITAASIAISLMFSARTFFFILAILTSLLGVRYFSTRHKSHIGHFAVVIAGVFTLICAFWLLQKDLAERIVDRILHGAYAIKFGHSLVYFNAIRDNFFQYPEVWKSGEYWFHNFFYDSHRTSGPWTAIIAWSFYLLTLAKAIWDLWTRKAYSWQLMTLFIVFTPYLFTTIPWESPESQMIILYGGISAMVLSPK